MAFVLLIVAYLVNSIPYPTPILPTPIPARLSPNPVHYTAMYIIVHIDILGKDYSSSSLVIHSAPVTVIYIDFFLNNDLTALIVKSAHIF